MIGVRPRELWAQRLLLVNINLNFMLKYHFIQSMNEQIFMERRYSYIKGVHQRSTIPYQANQMGHLFLLLFFFVRLKTSDAR